MESLFEKWNEYKQTFPSTFLCAPDSPEVLLLSRPPGKSRKQKRRGSKAGLQVKRRQALRLGFVGLDLRHGEPARCLRLIPLLGTCSSALSSLSSPAQIIAATIPEPAQYWSGDRWIALPLCALVFTPVCQANWIHVTAGPAFVQSCCTQ
ncbi:hypothetical protein WMY93_030971 [Mugilogobius chulae]|uniref:Uncharacterized protein n=1 Tax=Mugilogobius chulae TaxID=88201 RepID=A0AAW0MNQ7_9GOBI